MRRAASSATVDGGTLAWPDINICCPVSNSAFLFCLLEASKLPTLLVLLQKIEYGVAQYPMFYLLKEDINPEPSLFHWGAKDEQAKGRVLLQSHIVRYVMAQSVEARVTRFRVQGSRLILKIMETISLSHSSGYFMVFLGTGGATFRQIAKRDMVPRLFPLLLCMMSCLL